MEGSGQVMDTGGHGVPIENIKRRRLRFMYRHIYRG